MAVSHLRNIFMQCGFTVWVALSHDLKPPSDLRLAVCVHAWKRLHDSCCEEAAETHLCTSSGTLHIGAQTGLSRAECVAVSSSQEDETVSCLSRFPLPSLPSPPLLPPPGLLGSPGQAVLTTPVPCCALPQLCLQGWGLQGCCRWSRNTNYPPSSPISFVEWSGWKQHLIWIILQFSL